MTNPTSSGREASGLLFPMKTLLAFAFCLLPFALLAQEPVSGQPSAVSAPPDFATALIQSLASKYPWLTSVVSFIGLMRLLGKPLCMWLERRAAETATDDDDLLLARLERSVPVKVLDFFLDLGLSVKRDVLARSLARSLAPKPADATRVFSLLFAFCLLPFALGSSGCATGRSAQSVAFLTLSGTAQTVDAAMRVYAKAAVTGKVSPEQQEKIDAIHDRYRLAIQVAVRLARHDWQQPVTANVATLATELLNTLKELRL